MFDGRDRSWNVFGTPFPLGCQIGGTGMAKPPTSHPEIVLQLRMKHSVSDQKWRVVLEGPEPDERVRFDDLCELMRYLKALSQPDAARGLR
jgi:hypothetical protein